MSLLNIVSKLFEPAAKLIDDVHTSTEEKLEAKAKMLAMKAQFLEQALDYETKQLEAKTAIILAEVNSDSWITANWRPVTMLVFLGLVVLDQTGMLAFRLADEAWTLLQIGLGGYVVGRSAEKITPAVMKAFKS